MHDFDIHREEIKKISEKHNGLAVAIVFFEWVIIISVFYICLTSEIPLVFYLVGGVIISTRMTALYSLAHEACHYHIHSNKQINDWISKLLITWPLFFDINSMRRPHLLHHKHLQTEKDPEMNHLKYDEFQFPMKKSKFIFILFKDLSGINFLRYNFLSFFKLSTYKNMDKIQLLYYILVVSALLYFNLFFSFVFLWLIPYMTLFQLTNRIRLYSEHFNLSEEFKYKTRSIHLPLWQTFFIVPHGLGYHAEHHLYPGVPFYNLRKLHLILSQDSSYSKNVEIETSYWGMIKKLYHNGV